MPESTSPTPGATTSTGGATPLVGVVMGSASDYAELEPACQILAELGIPYEAQVVSAHRTPDWMFKYAETAASRGRTFRSEAPANNRFARPASL